MGGSKSGERKDQTHKSCAKMGKIRKAVAHPTTRFPTDDSDWPAFVGWVETGGIVAKALLTYREADWRTVWNIYKAGVSYGRSRGG